MSRRKIAVVGTYRIIRDSDTNEYLVKRVGLDSDDSAYFTSDKQDAFDTACAAYASECERTAYGRTS